MTIFHLLATNSPKNIDLKRKADEDYSQLSKRRGLNVLKEIGLQRVNYLTSKKKKFYIINRSQKKAISKVRIRCNLFKNRAKNTSV